MKNTLLVLLGFCILGFAGHSFSAQKVVNCPAINASQYGKTSYYDHKTGRVWTLNWLSQATPVWKTASIPKTSHCGTGKSNHGMRVNYQCAVYQCKSDALIATLEQSQALKCFSTYVSTQNTFYCDGFTI